MLKNLDLSSEHWQFVKSYNAMKEMILFFS
jgi:hypothetical protein